MTNEEYHKCSKCKHITYGLDGFAEMIKHTQNCKKKHSNLDSIICLFTSFKRGVE